MRRTIFSILFVLFLALFAWEGPKTLRLVLGDKQGDSVGNSLAFWIIIGVLALVCSGVVTWYSTRKSEKKDEDGV